MQCLEWRLLTVIIYTKSWKTIICALNYSVYGKLLFDQFSISELTGKYSSLLCDQFSISELTRKYSSLLFDQFSISELTRKYVYIYHHPKQGFRDPCKDK